MGHGMIITAGLVIAAVLACVAGSTHPFSDESYLGDHPDDYPSGPSDVGPHRPRKRFPLWLLPILSRPGRDGEDGEKGQKGWMGSKGNTGTTGSPGVPGDKGNRGFTGPLGRLGIDGEKGDDGSSGDTGDMGNRGMDIVRSTVVYTRWGRSDCHGDDERLDVGFASAARHYDSGGGANILCLPNNPSFDDAATMFSSSSVHSKVVGIRYQTSGSPLASVNGMAVQCAMCSRNHAFQIMVPGTAVCPGNLIMVYNGYLMSSRDTPSTTLLNNGEGHFRTEYICVDRNPVVPIGAATDTEAEIFHVHIDCDTASSLNCGVAEAQLTCVVCSFTGTEPVL